jgi:hypothetical protein
VFVESKVSERQDKYMSQSIEEAREILEGISQMLLTRTRQDDVHQLYLEPYLLQVLMTVTNLVPQELQLSIREIIDTVRTIRKEYGSYVTLSLDQLVDEQIVSLHEDEEAAKRGLARVRMCDVTGRIAPVQMARSPLPAERRQQVPQEEVMWAVLISAEVDRKALLARLFPPSPTRLGETVVAHDKALS